MARENGIPNNGLSQEAIENLRVIKTVIAETSRFPMKLEAGKYKFYMDLARMKVDYDTYKGKKADYQSAFYEVIEYGDPTETPVTIKLPCNQNVSGKIARLLFNGPRWIGVEKTLNNDQTRYIITPAD